MLNNSAGHAVPAIVDRATFQAELDALRAREKSYMRQADALSASRRRLPMVAIDGSTALVGKRGGLTLLDAFEGRQMLIAYYYMWFNGRPAAEQCEGCTFFTSQVRELSHLHSRDVTYATFCQGSYDESVRYRDFMGWEMPWYSVETSVKTLLAGRRPGLMYLICYLRQGSDVFETYWTTRRGVEAMDNSYRLLDLTVYGRQEDWEDSPSGWPQYPDAHPFRCHGRPISQWPRLKAGHNDDLATNKRQQRVTPLYRGIACDRRWCLPRRPNGHCAGETFGTASSDAQVDTSGNRASANISRCGVAVVHPCGDGCLPNRQLDAKFIDLE